MQLRLTLRQLNIEEKSDGTIELNFKCKICNCRVAIRLTKEEWLELESGIPFLFVFTGIRLVEVQHLKKGLCKLHGEIK